MGERGHRSAIFVGEATSQAGGKPFDGKRSDGSEHGNGSGWRLARILGMTPDEMQKAHTFYNLSDSAEEWDYWKVRTKAMMVLAYASSEGRKTRRKVPVVLLGRRVAKAFDLGELPYYSLFTPEHARYVFVALPHPSGRCRVWNKPTSAGLAKAALVRAGVI